MTTWIRPPTAVFHARPLHAVLVLLVAAPVLVSGGSDPPGRDDPRRVALPSADEVRDDAVVHGAAARQPSTVATERSVERPEPRYPPLRTVRPEISITTDDRNVLDIARATQGVRHVAVVRRGRTTVSGARGGRELTVASVDPPGFRRLVPQPTADAVGVWERLDEGEGVFLHARVDELGLELGGYAIVGNVAGLRLRVGALATNGTPPVADLIVDRRTGARLGLDDVTPTVLVALDPDADAGDVAAELRGEVDGEVEVIPDPRRSHAVTDLQRRGAATVWDLLAYCESSGNWHADTGNGYYGGLQFLPESWWLVGGRGMPHEASREEQIHRAELLLAIQGWEAWPVCSVKVGLRPPP